MNKEANIKLLENIRLLNKLAHKLNSVEFDDTKQIMYETFIRMYPKFNPKKGSLSTFITTQVYRQAVRAYEKERNVVKLPDYVHNIRRQYRKGLIDGSFEEFELLKSRRVFPFCHISFVAYSKIIESLNNESLTRVYNDCVLEDTNTLQDKDLKVNDSYLTSTEDNVEHSLLLNKINRQIDKLPIRQKIIIEKYYGLNDNQQCTLEEIGRMFNITKEAVRSNKTRTLATLRNRMKI